ncbi:MAG: Spo0B domain-containing protein [Syntrophomonadaceae bacterium]|nr:Spo0B domain-containing protein [Syntrophomonadaceae bacterium]
MEAEQMVSLIRRIRHDFSNHLQVISGYLDMQQPQKAKAYLTTLMDDIVAERVIFQSQSGDAALYFYEQVLTAYNLGVALHYEDIDIDSWEILKAKGEPCCSLAQLCRELIQSQQDVIVYLSIYEDAQGLDMFFSCEEWEVSPQGVRLNKE